MSRIEAGAFSPERQAVPIDELVTDRLRQLSGLFRHVRVQVELPADLPLVDGDYTQLEQVVTNLLENAGPPRPAGIDRAGRRPPPAGGRRCEVRVADEGIGAGALRPLPDIRAVPPGRGERVERSRAGHLQGDRRGPRRDDRRPVQRRGAAPSSWWGCQPGMDRRGG